MIKNLLFFFALLISGILCGQEESKSREQILKKLNQKVPQILRDFSVPGAVIAIIDDGEIVLQKGYGFADVEKGVKVTTKTGFNIASISKTIAAWGVMKLVQDGKIDLDAPAERYLTRWRFPESKFNSNEVTIRRLLSHTAGLSLHGYDGWTPNDTLPTIEESLSGKTNGSGRVEIIMKPGTKYQYSGGGTTVLQLIIEEVTGQKFEHYMQEQILNPLGMTNSSFKIDDKIMAASATPYDNFGEATTFELFTAQAAAGLHTTIEDFTHFAYANLYLKKDNSVLSAEIIQQMMESAPEFNDGYGLGYERDTRRIMKGLRGHSGGNTGWQSFFRVDPATNDGFMVFTNGGAGYNIINAVYCEWFGWNKGEKLWEDCTLQPSVANKLKQIIDEKGIEDIAAAYATLKKEQPDKYNFAENQLNNLGYFYLARKEFKKAIAVFQLNADAFPNAFNVYDSYGEALLANGDREGAIENYKKSIKLNPGNAHGIGVLNELGISVDDLMEFLPVSLNSKIWEGYAGRYQTTSGDMVTVRVLEGRLTAEMQEQELTLIAQSAARFVIFGEGSVVTFFTAATGTKGLWVKERIWRKLSDDSASDSESKDLARDSTEQGRSKGNFLVFRNKSSWGRVTDFENVLSEIGCNYDRLTSDTMADLELSLYDVIIIPGNQTDDFYNDYINNIERFDDFVTNGGTLLLELNNALNWSISLPRGVTIVPHSALENAITAPDHPVFFPLSGKRLIWARHSSSGYFQNVPDDALILAVETDGADALSDRPTFIEYPYGEGQIIAAFQCFHDRDGSGRGPLMESVISHALNISRKKKD